MISLAEERKASLINTFALLGAVGSLVMTLVYGTWFVSSIEKRISILEQNYSITKQQQDSANDAQDKSFIRFQDSVNSQLTRMEDKIEKIYLVIAKPKGFN